MYGLTRATTTLIGAAVAGFLIWLAGDAFDEGGLFAADATGRYWAVVGLLAAGGLVMALSQLLGGWTKWGWPRVSGPVFLAGFLPALVVGLWVLFYLDPGDYWLADKIRDWSGDLGVESVVQDLSVMFPAIAFALGLVFGFTFDTSGPHVPSKEPVVAAPPRRDKDETVVGAGADPEEPTRRLDG